ECPFSPRFPVSEVAREGHCPVVNEGHRGGRRVSFVNIHECPFRIEGHCEGQCLSLPRLPLPCLYRQAKGRKLSSITWSCDLHRPAPCHTASRVRIATCARTRVATNKSGNHARGSIRRSGDRRAPSRVHSTSRMIMPEDG